jgi:hypothetical protein
VLIKTFRGTMEISAPENFSEPPLLSQISLPSRQFLHANSINPTMDVVVSISTRGVITLWRITGGAKVWEWDDGEEGDLDGDGVKGVGREVQWLGWRQDGKLEISTRL